MLQKDITIYGCVQGVGFRPYTAELAEELGIIGTVQNIGGVVKIHAGGEKEALDEFIHRLFMEVGTKIGVRIDRIEVKDVWTEEKLGFMNRSNIFSIVASETQTDSLRFLPADLPTCDSCVREMQDENNRRYRYPFISCTSCGPRFSIMERVPYDRETITMRKFSFCQECQKEYTTKGDRRRHAQTISCKHCGPRLRLDLRETSDFSPQTQEEILQNAIQLLQQGKILAVKDIGGFHFVCRADRKEPVLRLRDFKNRERKPFAVMFPDIERIEHFCVVSETEKKLLLSDARPIVLLQKKKGEESEHPLVSEICGESQRIGAFLPCNPLQILLLQAICPLVMTSGNRGGEPIQTEDDGIKAYWEKSDVPDAILTHDRKIIYGLDDSIYQVTDCGKREVVQILRRARGLVPEPLELPQELSCDTFATGGDRKAVFALGRKNMAYLSGHFGDLTDVTAIQNWKQAIRNMEQIFDITPEQFVCDTHPGYVSTKWMLESASSHQTSTSLVQHHYAHTAAVIAEHRLQGAVLGVTYDGTGYGEDGTIWGGEFLLYSHGAFQRVGHLTAVDLMSGDVSSQNASVTAYCYLYAAVRKGYLFKEELQQISLLLEEEQKFLLENALKHRIHTIPSSSVGRLFDAVAAILGICMENSYEGECPERLQGVAEQFLQNGLPDFSILQETEDWILKENKVWLMDGVKLISLLVKKKLAGEKTDALAFWFHQAFARGTVELCKNIRNSGKKNNEQPMIQTVALGGGTMYNSILLRLLLPELEANGFSVYLNEKVPSGDGGLAYGQLYLESQK